MSDKIGILGQVTTATPGTTTAYTVPSGKAALIRLEYSGISGVNSTLSVAVNGLTTFTTAALTSGNICYSTAALMINTGAATVIDGTAQSKVVAPGPAEYYISAGQTVTYTLATAAFSSLTFRVVGTEVDVT